jgi:hypothetical protein
MKQQSSKLGAKTVPETKGGTKSGGVTSMAMKKVGRNMARANYQKSGGRGR